MTDATRYPTLGTDDGLVGSVEWLTPTNIYVQDAAYSAAIMADDPTNPTVRAKLIKPDGTLSSYYVDVVSGGLANYAFDNTGYPLWGETLTAEDVNSDGFGVALQGIRGSEQTHILRATKFDNPLPPAADIINIAISFYGYRAYSAGSFMILWVDVVKVVISYGLTSKITGIQSIAGIQSITF